jgi:hypothetical protein
MTDGGISASVEETQVIQSLSEVAHLCIDLSTEATDELQDRDYGGANGYLPVEVSAELTIEITDDDPEGADA